jgi:mannosyltransferase OCH1-like enzyme
MRREIKLMLIVDGLFLLYVLSQVVDLISLLSDEAWRERLSEPELRPVEYSQDSSGNLIPDRELLIPKIIHQTYKTEEIPERWEPLQKSCKEGNADYEYILWTDASAEQFIRDNYAWFLDTYLSYPYTIMRADVIRYFALYHYGGIYIDLDCGCEQSLDTLLTFPSWYRKTDPTGISNDVIGSMKNHPFLKYVIDNLKKYNRNWIISYLTVMYSTGPLMLSVLWKKYLSSDHPQGADVRVLYPPEFDKHTAYFFKDYTGSTWHQGDAQFVLFLGDHIFMTVIVSTLLVLALLYCQFLFYQFLVSRSFRRFYWTLRSAVSEHFLRKRSRITVESLPLNERDVL